jgi:hypothetical protein
MLPVLLEQDHGQEAWPGKAARQHMKGCPRLRNPLARPAGELFPNVLDDFPSPRHHLQSLGHVFTEFGKPRRAAASAGSWARHEDPLTRQMLRKWLAGWLSAGEAMNGRRVIACHGGLLGGEFIFGSRGFELFQLEFHLVEKPRLALGSLAIELAPHLLD